MCLFCYFSSPCFLIDLVLCFSCLLLSICFLYSLKIFNEKSDEINPRLVVGSSTMGVIIEYSYPLMGNGYMLNCQSTRSIILHWGKTYHLFQWRKLPHCTPFNFHKYTFSSCLPLNRKALHITQLWCNTQYLRNRKTISFSDFGLTYVNCANIHSIGIK